MTPTHSIERIHEQVLVEDADDIAAFKDYQPSGASGEGSTQESGQEASASPGTSPLRASQAERRLRTCMRRQRCWWHHFKSVAQYKSVAVRAAVAVSYLILTL